jgi:hypothetical protein
MTASGYVFRPMNEEDTFRLSVATFNERATFAHHTNGGEYPFLLMTREV